MNYKVTRNKPEHSRYFFRAALGCIETVLVSQSVNTTNTSTSNLFSMAYNIGKAQSVPPIGIYKMMNLLLPTNVIRVAMYGDLIKEKLTLKY